MALAQQIARLGAAVERGELTLDEAVQLLLEYSDGGLTRVGAKHSLADWRATLATYERIRDDAMDRLIQLEFPSD